MQFGPSWRTFDYRSKHNVQVQERVPPTQQKSIWSPHGFARDKVTELESSVTSKEAKRGVSPVQELSMEANPGFSPKVLNGSKRTIRCSLAFPFSLTIKMFWVLFWSSLNGVTVRTSNNLRPSITKKSSNLTLKIVYNCITWAATPSFYREILWVKMPKRYRADRGEGGGGVIQTLI